MIIGKIPQDYALDTLSLLCALFFEFCSFCVDFTLLGSINLFQIQNHRYKAS